MSAILQQFEHSLALPFFEIGMKADLFQSCGHWWGFQICWHMECSIFTASSFRIWNSSAGIPSPPIALFVLMLPKAHLISHSRMSGSTWVVTPSLLSGSWSSFLYSSSVYSCHLFLIFAASVRSIPFLFFIVPSFAWKVPLVSIFLEEISSPSHSVIFLYFFALIIEEGFLISPCYSLELCIQMGVSFLFSFASPCFPDSSAGKESPCNVGDLGSIPGLGTCPGEGKGYPLQYSGLENSMDCIVYRVAKSQTRLSSFHFTHSLLFIAVYKASSDNSSAFLHFFFLITASCTVSRTSVHSFSGSLSDLIPWISLSLPLYSSKGFDLGHTRMVQWFSLLASI